MSRREPASSNRRFALRAPPDAAPCGFCTPGMILTAVALLEENPHPTEAEVRAGLAGNLCRCTGYAKIVEAVLAASAHHGPGE